MMVIACWFVVCFVLFANLLFMMLLLVSFGIVCVSFVRFCLRGFCYYFVFFCWLLFDDVFVVLCRLVFGGIWVVLMVCYVWCFVFTLVCVILDSFWFVSYDGVVWVYVCVLITFGCALCIRFICVYSRVFYGV